MAPRFSLPWKRTLEVHESRGAHASGLGADWAEGPLSPTDAPLRRAGNGTAVTSLWPRRPRGRERQRGGRLGGPPP